MFITDKLQKAYSEVLNTSLTSERIRILEDFLKSLDLKYYCFYNEFLYQKGKNPTSRITNYPAGWMTDYVKKNFGHIDPALQVPIKENTLYNWNTEKGDNKVYKKALERGIVWGTSIPIFGKDKIYSILSLVYKSNEDLKRFNDSKTMNELHAFAILFHVIVTNSRRDYEHNPLTKKEVVILTWLHKGRTYLDIAEIENISLSTV